MAREKPGIAPGWYKDPADPTTQRWWDGEGWLGDPLPADATPPPGPPEPATSHRSGGGQPGDGQPHPDQIPPAVPGPGLPPPGDTIPPPPGASPVPPGDAIPPGHPTGPGQPGTGLAAGPGQVAGSGQVAAPGQVAVRRGQPPPRPHGLPLATLGTRLVARLVDLGLIFGLNVLVNGWFVYQYVTEIAPIVSETQRRIMAGESLDDLPDASDAQTLLIVILIIAAALWFAYEVPAVANNGQTPGKRLLGIRVVRLEASQPLGFGRSFRRWNTMGLPTLLWWCFGIGFLLQLIDVLFALFDRPMQQALHDKSAHTAVVSVAPRGSARATTGGGAAAPEQKEPQNAPTDPS